MIIRLHGEEVSHTSRGTPSFEDEYVDESDDSLRQEFLDLLDKAASTAQKGTHADQALGASIVAAGSISVVTPKVDTAPRQDSKSLLREVSAPIAEDSQADAAAGEERQVSAESVEQNPYSNRSVVSIRKESDGAPVQEFEPSQDTESEPLAANVNKTVSEGEGGEYGKEYKQTETSADEEISAVQVALTQDELLLTSGNSDSSGETLEVSNGNLAPLEDQSISADPSLSAEATVGTIPLATSSDSAKIAESAGQISSNEVSPAASTAEVSLPHQSVNTNTNISGGTENDGMVQVTSKGGSDLANLLASLKQEPIVLRPEEGNKRQVEVVNPFLANAIPLLQRPDASVKLALLKQSFEQLKGAISDVKGTQGIAQSIGTQMGGQGQIPGVSSSVAPGEIASKVQVGFQKEVSRPLPKGIAHRTMERVESALKEAAKSRDGKTLSFRLDPPQLGQVKVDVSLKDGALHARMVPENPQVATLLREKASELQSTLRRLGLNVETVTVSVGNESGSVSFSGGESSSDGKTFQQERNKMPGQDAQVVETTFGNELALQGPATKTVVDDHWVA